MTRQKTFLPMAAFALFAVLAISAPVSRSEAASGAAPSGMELIAPMKGKIKVAFVIGRNAQVIDFTGPWEVFQDVHITDRGDTHDDMMPFELFTVAESTEPVRATGGLMIIPDYSFDNAPQPDVIVVPAVQDSPSMLAWLRRASPKADITMSVCTGAFVVAEAGLLDGKTATTHHRFFDQFEKRFPKVSLRKGRRFVENEGVSSAGGLTSGMDMALRVVERYFGTPVAQQTADYMEYESAGWRSGEARASLETE
jgi:transcriptional regulator GlxA family with amidase domain